MAYVLVVDDDGMQRYLLLDALLRRQHVVRVAEDGEQAFDMFKQADPSTPIIAMSANNAVLLHQATMLGAGVCMDKPLDMPALHTTIDALLGGRRGSGKENVNVDVLEACSVNQDWRDK